MGETIEWEVNDEIVTFTIEDDMFEHLNWVPSEGKTKSQAEVFASFGSQLGFTSSTEVLADDTFKRQWKLVTLKDGTSFMSVRDLMTAMGDAVKDKQGAATQDKMRAENRDASDKQLELAVRLKRDCETAGLTGMATALGAAIGLEDGATIYGLNSRAIKLLKAHRGPVSRTTAAVTQGEPTSEPTTEAEVSEDDAPPF